MASKDETTKVIENLYKQIYRLKEIEETLGFTKEAELLNRNILTIDISFFTALELEAFAKMLRDGCYAEETRFLVSLFLKTNYSDKEMAEMTGLSSSTIGRRLNPSGKSEPFRAYTIAFGTDWERIYQEVLKRRQENIMEGKARGGHISKINSIIVREENGRFQENIKLRLDTFSQDVNAQAQILLNIGMYFHLNTKTLASLFGFAEVEVIDILKSVGDTSGKVEFLVNYEDSNQLAASSDFQNFYIEYFKMLKNHTDPSLKLLSINDVVKSLLDVINELGLNKLDIKEEFGEGRHV